MIIADLDHMETIAEGIIIEAGRGKRGRRGWRKRWQKGCGNQNNTSSINLTVNNYVTIEGDNNTVEIENDIDIYSDQYNYA